MNRKYQPPVSIEMPFDEALERYAQTDPKELHQSLPTDKSSPVTLVDDPDTGDRLLVYTGKDGIRVDLRVLESTFYASQAQMAEMFGVDRTVVGRHIKNIFKEGELPEEGNVHLMHISSTKPTKLYSLNVMISVGYRVESKLGTMFRIWATDVLFQYLTKGFVLDDRRLKKPDGAPDFFDELFRAHQGHTEFRSANVDSNFGIGVVL